MPYPYSIAASIYPQRSVGPNTAEMQQQENPRQSAVKRRMKKQKPGY